MLSFRVRRFLIFLCCVLPFVLTPALVQAQTVFTVTTTADASHTGGCTGGPGDCSLRGAIELANATANADATTPDRIEFDIDGTGPHVIPVGQDQYNGTSFPVLTEAVVIDGTTEPDYDATNAVPSVVLHDDDDGGYSINGLQLDSHSGSTIKGLSFTRFNGSNVAAIAITDGSAHAIEQNFVGVRPDGTVYGNTVGVHVEDSPGNRIEGNRIRGQTSAGILVEGDPSTGNRITQNAIYENGLAAIDLGDDALTPNDGTSDTDSGPNTLLNTPIMRSSSASGGQLSVTYEVPAGGAYPLDVEFFLASPSSQAEQYLGTDSYSTTGTKTASLSVGALPSGFEIVATATDANGNTSELGVELPPEAETYTVTTAADGGAGSLRRAIRAANTDPNANTIAFDIPGGGPHTIVPSSMLPTLLGPVTVDGRTEPDYTAGTPAIVIDGSSLEYRYAHGLEIEAGGASGVHGLAIVNVHPSDFSGTGLSLVDTDFFRSSSDTFEITGNFFGVLPDGQTAAPNWTGLSVLASYATVGGTTAGTRNVISGNLSSGMRVSGDDNVIIGNYVGVAADGGTALGNEDDGIHFANSGAGGSTLRTRVGGVGEGNVISANGDDGIHLHARRVDVYGNKIGVGSDGTTPLGNGDEGISFYYGSPDNRIGGTASGQGNVIAHNGSNGVLLPYNGSAEAKTSSIRGNSIFLNRGLGIDLGGKDSDDGNGINRNDGVPEVLTNRFSYVNDEDEGANRQQNYPRVLSASVDEAAGTMQVTYRVPSDPAYADYPIAVDFYEATYDVGGTASDGWGGGGNGKRRSGGSASVPMTDAGAKSLKIGEGTISLQYAIQIPVPEGRTYLASDTYTEADYQAGSKSVTLPLQQNPTESGSDVVATATDASNNTSEFSFSVYAFTWAAGGSIGGSGTSTAAAKATDPPGHRFATYNVTVDPSYTAQEWTVAAGRELIPPAGSLPSGRELATFGSWTLTPADPAVGFAAEACFDLTPLTHEEENVDFSALEVWRRPDAQTAWSNLAHESNVTVALNNPSYPSRICADGLTSLGEFIVAADPSALPVELAEVRAQIQNGAVQLLWQTTAETNNAGFHVERKAASGEWRSLEFFKGHGTTEAVHSYRYTDEQLPFTADTLVYRLRQVDHDGTESLSDEIIVALGTPERLALHAPFPNPVRESATLRYAIPTAMDVEIGVYNVLGQRMATVVRGPLRAGSVERRVDVRRWPSGVYFVRLVAGGDVQTQRLTVVQ